MTNFSEAIIATSLLIFTIIGILLFSLGQEAGEERGRLEMLEALRPCSDAAFWQREVIMRRQLKKDTPREFKFVCTFGHWEYVK